MPPISWRAQKSNVSELKFAKRHGTLSNATLGNTSVAVWLTSLRGKYDAITVLSFVAFVISLKAMSQGKWLSLSLKASLHLLKRDPVSRLRFKRRVIFLSFN